MKVLPQTESNVEGPAMGEIPVFAGPEQGGDKFSTETDRPDIPTHKSVGSDRAFQLVEIRDRDR